MSCISEAIAIIERRMFELAKEERYEEAGTLKARLNEIRKLLGLKHDPEVGISTM